MLKRFGELAIGDRFFDPVSGEYYLKLSDTEAYLDSGGDAWLGEAAEFEPTEGAD